MFGKLATVDMKVIQTGLWVAARMATCSLNYLTGGHLHEPFCSRVWRCWVRGAYPRQLWAGLYATIDAAFGPVDPDHCFKQYVKTIKRRVPDPWSISWLWQTF